MKKLLTLTIVLIVTALVLVVSNTAMAQCTTIQDGVLLTSDGELITPGYDVWGYNYQAHMFNGGYCDAYRDAEWCQPYVEVNLLMKWNDAWLSNQDCDGDSKLDRHFGYTSYRGSGAWLTNHQSGSYELEVKPGKMKTIHWTYFVKIVAAPADAHMGVAADGEDATKWYETDGTEIGEAIWGDFAIIQQVENDAGSAIHGKQYISPASTGFGYYTPKD